MYVVYHFDNEFACDHVLAFIEPVSRWNNYEAILACNARQVVRLPREGKYAGRCLKSSVTICMQIANSWLF